MLDRRSAIALVIFCLSACDEAGPGASGSETSEPGSETTGGDAGDETGSDGASATADEGSESSDAGNDGASTSANDSGDGGDDDTGGPTGDSDGDSGSSAETSGDEASDADDSDDEGSSEASSGDDTSAGDTSEDESTGDTGETGDTGDDGGDGSKVGGFVTRSADIDGMNDGIGTLYLSLMAECSADAAPVYSAVLPAADFSPAGAKVEFSIAGVAAGRYHLTGFLDDNDNASDSSPGPDRGDLVAAEGIGPACTEVVVDGGDVDSATLDLNFVMPFRR